MFGWRARIALVLPADNTVTEPELYGLGIRGISYHTFRLTATAADEMRAQASELAAAVREMGVDVVVYACAETSFNDGGGTHKRLSELMADECGLPVVTATGAMIEAITWLGLSKIALVTPYSAASGALLEQLLADEGILTTSAVHRDFRLESDDPRTWYVTNLQPAHVAYRMIRQADGAQAEGVLVSATNFRTLEILQTAEDDVGKPVVSSNQSIVWACLNRLGARIEVPGYGRLLRWQR